MWKTLSSKIIFEHPRLTLIEDEVELPNGTKTTYLRFRDDYPGGACIIAQRSDGKILIQKEYSYPINGMEYFFPGGSLHPGEDPAIAANREFMEEAGLSANQLEFLGYYYFDIRRSQTKSFVYYTSDFTERKMQKDVEESIEHLWLTREEIQDMISKNVITNSYFLTIWCLFSAKK